VPAIRWTDSGAPPGPQTLAWVTADLERARSVTPGDPEIEELLGELAGRRIDRPDFRGEALAHFARAIAQRPTSPYTWAAVADARYRKGDTGPAFETALRRAAELGPAEPEVQRTLIDIGLAQWDRLPEPMRQELRKALAQSMERYPFKTLPIVSRHGHLEMACPYVAGDARLARTSWPRRCQLQPPK